MNRKEKDLFLEYFMNDEKDFNFESIDIQTLNQLSDFACEIADRIDELDNKVADLIKILFPSERIILKYLTTSENSDKSIEVVNRIGYTASELSTLRREMNRLIDYMEHIKDLADIFIDVKLEEMQKGAE